uniref:La1-like protein n=1 Tax=Hadrurus spadix TaxID=141984 RepID=A0A1W7RAA0_9SCOR
MMKTMLVFVFLFAFIYAANAGPVTRRTCRNRNGGIMREGEIWKDPNHCSIYTCEIYNNEAELIGMTCAQFQVGKGCRKAPGRGKFYPNCCPRAVC